MAAASQRLLDASFENFSRGVGREAADKSHPTPSAHALGAAKAATAQNLQFPQPSTGLPFASVGYATRRSEAECQTARNTASQT